MHHILFNLLTILFWFFFQTFHYSSGETKSCTSYGKEIDRSYTLGKTVAVLSGLFNGLIGIVAQVSNTYVT